MPAPKPVKSSKSHDREKPARRRDAIDLESIRSLQCGFTAFFACVSVGYGQRTEDCDYRNCCCSAAFHVPSPVAYGSSGGGRSEPPAGCRLVELVFRPIASPPV